MIVIWAALAVVIIVFVFTLLEVTLARWWWRRHRSAAGVALATGYYAHAVYGFPGAYRYIDLGPVDVPVLRR